MGDDSSAGDGELTAVNSTLSINNSAGGGASSVICGNLPLTGGEPGGLAPNFEGRLGRYVKLTKLTVVSRYDFSGGDTVKADGASVPVSGEVQVYIKTTGRYDTLSRARGFAEKFTLYIDRPVSSGGKIRLVIAV